MINKKDTKSSNVLAKDMRDNKVDDEKLKDDDKGGEGDDTMTHKNIFPKKPKRELPFKKKFKKQLVNMGLYGLRMSGLSDNTILKIVSITHYMSGVLHVLTVAFLPTKFLVVIIIQYLLVCIVIIAFIYFQGCIVSTMEYKLSGEDYTIVDPCLKLMDFEVNNKNRYNITIIGMIAYQLLTTYIVYKRKFF